MSGIRFLKMHGLGNDFVVLDRRAGGESLSPEAVRRIADRHRGVGCDQVLEIGPSRGNGAAAYLRIHNADGGEVGACGNGTRCVAKLLMAEAGQRRIVIESRAALLAAELREGGAIALDMGEPRHLWHEIPLARATDTLHLPIAEGPFRDGVAVNMGNPHAVFFVEDAEHAPLEILGPKIEHDPLFPERTNVGAAELRADGSIRLRVWERGAGLTLACGSGACAALVAAHRRGRAGRKARIVLDGGALEIDWRADNHVVMTGPAETSFTGELPEEFFR